MAATSSGGDSFESPSLSDQVARVRAAFAATFGQEPRWVVAAPGRVNLIGEHTDYNAGFVFPLAIERYVVLAAAPPRDRVAGDLHVRVHSTLLGETAQFALDALEPERRDWTSYLRGAIAGCMERGMAPDALDVLVDSNVPMGGGLSSSAALEVATATLMEAVTGHTLDPVDKARLAQHAEHVYANMPCGIMDQFSSTLGEAGKLLLIDCRSETADLVALDDPGIAVLVINSNVKHHLSGSEYPERRAACEQAAQLLGVEALRDISTDELLARESELDPLLFRRARHVVSENERTIQAAEALQAGDWATVGELMYASHDSLRLDFEVSCPELDALVEIAREIGAGGGVIGSRMTGGGFGGSTVSLVESGREREIAENIGAEYTRRTGRTATAFVTKPARGAHIVAP
ncbi:MAG TPA: galactokinase [Lacipirellulaceae bacterium]|nr:galactokinase [Lacipirellulaceae bacterium]